MNGFYNVTCRPRLSKRDCYIMAVKAGSLPSSVAVELIARVFHTPHFLSFLLNTFRLKVMYALLLVALSFSAFMSAQGINVEKRQNGILSPCDMLEAELIASGADCPDFSNLARLADLLTDSTMPQWNTDSSRDWLSDTLDNFCTNCLNYTVDFFSLNCSSDDVEENMQIVSLVQDYYCASTAGDYCLVEYMEALGEGHILSLEGQLQCELGEDGPCSAPCMEVLLEAQESLGCCAVNVFNTSGARLSEVLPLFEACEIPLPQVDRCSGAQAVATINILLILVAMMLLGLSL